MHGPTICKYFLSNLSQHRKGYKKCLVSQYSSTRRLAKSNKKKITSWQFFDLETCFSHYIFEEFQQIISNSEIQSYIERMRLSFIAIFFFKETHIFMPSIVFVLINKRNQFFVKTSTGIPSSTKFNIKNQKNKLSKKKNYCRLFWDTLRNPVY